MALAEQVERDLVDAMKARDRSTVGTLRLLKATVKNAEVSKRGTLTDAEYLDAIRREVKLHREAAVELEHAGRPEGAAHEHAEADLLERYLPAQLDDDAIREAVADAIRETGSSGPGDLGRVMARVMPALRGRAEGARINQVARELLQRAHS